MSSFIPAGRRLVQPSSEINELFPEVWVYLNQLVRDLEINFLDTQEVELTTQQIFTSVNQVINIVQNITSNVSAELVSSVSVLNARITSVNNSIPDVSVLNARISNVSVRLVSNVSVLDDRITSVDGRLSAVSTLAAQTVSVSINATGLWNFENSYAVVSAASFSIPLPNSEKTLIEIYAEPLGGGGDFEVNLANGASVQNGASDYSWFEERFFQGGAGEQNFSDAADSSIELFNLLGNDQYVRLEVKVIFANTSSRRTTIETEGIGYFNDTTLIKTTGAGFRNALGTHDTAVFSIPSRTLTGNARVYSLNT